jgi:hypothetical protein
VAGVAKGCLRFHARRRRAVLDILPQLTGLVKRFANEYWCYTSSEEEEEEEDDEEEEEEDDDDDEGTVRDAPKAEAQWLHQNDHNQKRVQEAAAKEQKAVRRLEIVMAVLLVIVALAEFVAQGATAGRVLAVSGLLLVLAALVSLVCRRHRATPGQAETAPLLLGISSDSGQGNGPGSLHVRLTTADSTVAAVDPNDLYAEFKASGACPFNFDDLPDGSKERIYQVWFDTRTHAGINTKFAEYGLRSAGAAFDPKTGRRILARTQQSGPKGPKAGRHQYGHNHELVSGDATVQLEEQLGMLQDNPPRMDEGDKYLDWERAVAETEEALHASLVPDTMLH